MDCPSCQTELEHEDTFGNLDHCLEAIGHPSWGRKRHPVKAGDIYWCPQCEEWWHTFDDGELRNGYPSSASRRWLGITRPPGAPGSAALRREWSRGYYCAVAAYIRTNCAEGFCDADANDLFRAGGDWRQADPEDIETFRAHGLIPPNATPSATAEDAR